MTVLEDAGIAGDVTALGRSGRVCSDWPASIMSPTRNSAVARLCKPGTKGAAVSTRLTDRQIMGRYGGRDATEPSMVKPPKVLPALAAVPGVAYLAISLVVIAALGCKIGAEYSFNVNEGWNAYWAKAAWTGADLYPPLAGLKLNNYLPLWFYLTGALGSVVGDNIRAGRAIAAAALLLDGAVISLIAREIVGAHRGWWLAGTAFIALFGLFHQDYAAADDPQILASLFMLIALWRVIRTIDTSPPLAMWAGVVLLMVIAGLIKHNLVATPLSIGLFLLLYGRFRAFVSFVGLSIIAVAVACTCLFLAYGKGIFALLLLPRPYHLGVAWSQSLEQFKQYGLLLAVIPFLAWRSDAKTRLILIYAVVALVLGVVLSGGDGVDVNVFFDLLFCIAIGLGVMGAGVARYVRNDAAPSGLRWAAVAGWGAIALLSPLIAVPSARDGIADAFAAVTEAAYADDLQYVRATPGPVVCRDPTLCYWAGKPLTLDLNNIRSIAFAAPALEDEVVARIEACEFPLIQLGEDWNDRDNGPLTDRIRAAIETRYKEVRATQYGLYWRPSCG
jgi:hypothetical protein